MNLIEKIKNLGDKRTVLFYGDNDFHIEFEGKRFDSKNVNNTAWVMLDIPYNARFSYQVTDEHSVRIWLADSGQSIEDNQIFSIDALIGEPQD